MKALDKVLNVHIPAGADLSEQAITASFENAGRFFQKMGYPHEAAVCESWLLDSQLEQWLRPDSQMLSFAKRFDRFRVYSPGSWAHRFLFGTEVPPAQLTEQDAHSSLQRAVLAHWQAGGELFDTGGVVLL